MVTKFPVLDVNFTLLVLGACRDQEERGLIRILDISGMHVSSLRNIKVVTKGPRKYLSWVRPKTYKTMECLIPPDNLDDILAFLTHKPHSREQYRRIVRDIGARAGYEGISPMTFRHNRCIRSIHAHDNNPFIVAQDMGCSVDVVFRNYSKLKEIEP